MWHVYSLSFCAQDISEWLHKKGGDKYPSPEIQNEILGLMSHAILCKIIVELQQTDYFTIMLGECVDSSNKEQLTICIRYVDAAFAVHEEFVGLYYCPDIKANTIFSIVKDTLLRLNLCLSRCCGQCYDGASNMAGSRNGLKTQILQEEPRALFTHCYGHSLNLAVADAIKSLSFLQSNMDTTFEISKLFQYSPKRLAMFQQLKTDLSHATIGFRILCPTRWTVRHETFRGILENYDTLLELWDVILNDSPDSKTRARINGVASQMKTFNFFFGACLLLLVFQHTDNLSKTLQHTKMSAAEGQTVAGMTVRTLQVRFGILKYHCLS